MRSFSELSDYDFELFVGDLLGSEFTIPFHAFPRGRDGGIDLLALTKGAETPTDSGAIVVQCKHSPEKDYRAIRSSLEAEERKGVYAQTDRYVLVTSAKLTLANKLEIRSIFNDRVSINDIIGRENLDTLLRRHPRVEEAHFKLWISSTRIMQRLVAAAEHTRSDRLKADLMRSSQTFVENGARTEAMEVLHAGGVCLLTGPPGVGKTLTARMMMLHLMADGWMPIAALGNVKELDTQWRDGERQALFFDDFLGQTTMQGELDRNEDAALVQLMEAVANDPSKYLILTSRNYILEEASRVHPKLNEPIVRESVVHVAVEQLNHAQRAHILYNHIYFSALREHVKADASAPEKLGALVEHPHYNPRLIEQAIKNLSRSTLRPNNRNVRSKEESLDVPLALRNSLDEPMTLWRHVLSRHLSPSQRGLVLTMASLESERGVAVPVLFELCRRLLEKSGATIPREPEFRRDMFVLEGDLLRTQSSRNHPVDIVHRLDPGLSDVLLDYAAEDADLIHEILDSAIFFEQAEWVLRVIDRRQRRGLDQHDVAVLVQKAVHVLCSLAGAWDPEQYYFIEYRGRGASSTQIFTHLRRRLELIHQVCAMVKISPADEYLATALSIGRPSGQNMSASIGAAILLELSNSGRPSWLKWKTELSLRLLRVVESQKDEAETFDDLADLLEVVEVDRDWRDEMIERFERWAQEEIDEMESDVGADSDDEDEEIAENIISETEDRLNELNALAERLHVHTLSVDELEHRLDALADQDDSPIAQRPERYQQEQIKFAPSPRNPNDIFRKF